MRFSTAVAVVTAITCSGLLSGCGAQHTSGPTYARLRVEAISEASSSATDPIVTRICKDVLGAQGRTVVQGTVTYAGNPTGSFGVGDLLYVVVRNVSLAVGTEAEFAGADQGSDEFIIEGQKVLVLEGGMYPVSDDARRASETATP